MIVIVCPGQGSQTPGFFLPWLEVPSFRESIETMQAASGIDLITHGSVSDADTIRDTSVAQPLIVSAGVATLAALFGQNGSVSDKVTGVAGHSVGEVTAAVATNVFSAEQGIRFVKARGDAMAFATNLEATSMDAILGGEKDLVEAKLLKLGLEPANYNGAGQIVAAGSVTAIAQLQAEGIAGARIIPLQVAGAFHTRYMETAAITLGVYANELTVSNPKTTLWTNADGSAINSGNEFLALMVDQVRNPVRWDLCMGAMVESGVTALIEITPAGTLTGLAKRSMPGIETLALKTPDDIDAALVLINNHA